MNRCYLCGRLEDELSVLVIVDGAIRSVCDPCWSKRDTDYLDERMDMTLEVT